MNNENVAFDIGYHATLKWIADGSQDRKEPIPSVTMNAAESADWWLGKQAAIDFANDAADDDEEPWEGAAMLLFTLVLASIPIYMLNADAIWIRIASLPMFLILWMVVRNVIRHMRARALRAKK